MGLFEQGKVVGKVSSGFGKEMVGRSKDEDRGEEDAGRHDSVAGEDGSSEACYTDVEKGGS